MVDPENFVARLRVLAQRLSPQGDAAVTAVLAAALESDPNGIEFHRRVVILIELARLARKQVAELTDDPSQQLYEEAIAGIVATLEMLDMRVNWATYAQVFNPRSLTLLETCERAVAYRLTTKQPAAEALAEALTDIQDAIKEVLDADIEPEAKQLLLEMLREVEGALLAYRLLGLAGLRRAVERTLGAAFLHQAILCQSRAPGVVKRAFKALGKALSVLKTLDFVAQLPEKVRDILSLLG